MEVAQIRDERRFEQDGSQGETSTKDLFTVTKVVSFDEIQQWNTYLIRYDCMPSSNRFLIFWWSVWNNSCMRPTSWIKLVNLSRHGLTPSSRALCVMKKHSVMNEYSFWATKRFSFSSTGTRQVSECRFLKWIFLDSKSAAASFKLKLHLLNVFDFTDIDKFLQLLH